MKKTWMAICQIYEYYPKCIKFIWQANRRCSLLAFIFSILSSLVPVIQIWISKIVLDNVVQTLDNATEGASIDWPNLLSPIGGIFAVWALGGICQSMSNGLMEQLGLCVKNHSHQLILRKASQLDIAFFDTSSFYDEMDRAIRDGYRATSLAMLSVGIIASAVSLIAILGLLVRVHWAAPLVILVTAMPQVVIGGYYASQRFSIVGALTRNRRVSDYLSRLLSSRESIKEIRIFGLHNEFLARFNDYWEAYTKGVIQIRFAQERSAFLFGLLSMTGTACIWGYAVIRAVGRHITIGDIALAFQAADRSRTGLVSLFRNLGSFYEHTLFAANLFRFLDIDPTSIEGALTPPTKSPLPMPKILSKGIEFRNVSFRYPRSDRFVLKNVSFSIKAGESVAIVGENGTGKTTLVKLLTRFYDPTEGIVFLDGKDLRDYDPKELHRQIGVIFQDFVRYDLSAKENIGFGQVEFLEDKEKIHDAAEKGGSSEIIRKLPEGFNTILGKTFDEGVDLSGGEWQKLALSRAFMRHAQILVLDEPTAALDAFAEYEIHKRFVDLTSDKTTIFISHRFSTVRMAQHILVLQNGKLVEEGSHGDLMNLNGLYTNMFNTQADRYR